jgi:predicted transcriptional regulator
MNLSGNDVPGIVATLAAAYFTGNRIGARDAPGVVRTIAETVASLSEARSVATPEIFAAATAPRHRLACAACGQTFRMVKRHLRETHDMTPEQYRATFALPPATPMVAPAYVAKQTESARQRHASKRVTALPPNHGLLPRNPATGVLRAASHR